MNILHLSDLHIGKKVNGFSMLDEQIFVLEQAIELIQKEKIEIVLIAGDVFDKAVAPSYALNVFADFLNKLNEFNTKIFIIAGNHDNSYRLSYLSGVLKKNKIYFCEPFEGKIEKIKANGINIFLLPYLHYFQIKKYFPECKDYNDAFKSLINTIELNKDEINILLAHQFVTSDEELILSENEIKSAGGLDNISYEIFKEFSYVALGHLHCPQKAGADTIRYAGSILKYSFSEINQKKVFTIVNIDENNAVNVKFQDIKFKRDFKKYAGYIDEFLDEKFYSNIKKDDYIMFTLYDESVIDAKKKLSIIYPNIMALEFDNSFTKNLNKNTFVNFSKEKTIMEHFRDFYTLQFGKEISDEEEKIAQDIVQSIEKGGA